MMRLILCHIASYVIEAVTVWQYYNLLFEKRRSNIAIAGMFFVLYTILCGFSFCGYTYIILDFSLCLFTNFFILMIGYNCSLGTSLLHGAFLSLLIIVTQFTAKLLIYYMNAEDVFYFFNPVIPLLSLILSRVFFLIIILASALIFISQKRAGENPHMVPVFCLLPLFSVFISVVILYFALNVDLPDLAGMTNVLKLMFLFTILIIVQLIFFLLYSYMRQSYKEYTLLQLSLQKEKADTAYYAILREQADSQHILVHDMKNHLQTIKILAEEEKNPEISRYISQLDEFAGFTRQERLCDHSLLNQILLHFMEECKKMDVAFCCDVRKECVDFMDAPSITALYGNLLSNAVESACQSHAKMVELTVVKKEKQGIVMLSILNSCDKPPLSDKRGGFHTWKRDDTMHGVGLESVKKVISRYQGVSQMYYDEDDKCFHTTIQFPVVQNVENLK